MERASRPVPTTVTVAGKHNVVQGTGKPGTEWSLKLRLNVGLYVLHNKALLLMSFYFLNQTKPNFQLTIN